MLEPDHRSLLTNLLTPPPGMVFDTGLATTYTLDPLTLLTIPLHLVWLASGEDRSLLADGVRLLEAIGRVSDRLTVFADRGHMQAPTQAHALYALLEKTIVEVRAPHGGAFHPKLWLLRFTRPDRPDDVVLRLGVLSRNLTADRCWDLVVQLDGLPTKKNRAANKELGELIAELPSFAFDDIDPARREQTARLAEELRRTEWEVPGKWDDVRFHVLGRTRRRWVPPGSDELAVISPFVKAKALEALCETTGKPLALVSRPDELAALDPAVRRRFGQCFVLDDAAETEDGEEAPRFDAVGLHAKAFVLRSGWDMHLFVGSANATDAALVRGHNVEVMAELVGRHSQVGRVESLLAEQAFGGVLAEFDTSTPVAEVDPAEAEAERALDAAQYALGSARLQVTCTREGDDAWRLELSPAEPVPLPKVALVGWPLSVREESAVDLERLTLGKPVDLGVFATADVTGLVAFAATAGEWTRRFALNLPIAGLPPDRDAAILRRVIRNREGFLRYLRLLLGDFAGEDVVGGPGDAGAGAANWAAGSGVEALLEDMVRAFSRDRERLHDVRRLVDRLLASEGGEDIVPPDFLAVWEVFATALEETR